MILIVSARIKKKTEGKGVRLKRHSQVKSSRMSQKKMQKRCDVFVFGSEAVISFASWLLFPSIVLEGHFHFALTHEYIYLTFTWGFYRLGL